MAVKKSQNSGEQMIFLERFRTAKGVPKRLYGEVKRFVERNKLVQEKDAIVRKPIVCLKCLQAHIMKKAQEIGVRGEIELVLVKELEYKTGHDGYYMDNQTLIKI
jgi:hypothetical protein